MNWSQLVVPALNDLKPYVPGITEEKLRRDTGLDTIFKFSSNEAPFAPSLAVTKAMQVALTQANRYPDTQALLDSLAAEYDVPVACLSLGNGSIDLIEALVRIFVDERHNVVVSRYGYSAYATFIKAQRSSARVAESTPAFGHSVDRLLAAVDADTRMILIDSPTNLSGQWLSPAEIERLLDALPTSVMVVLDEAYVEFTDAASAAHTARLPSRYPNLIVTRTFSKAYGLASMRIGFAIADRAVIDFLSRINRPFPVSGVALAGAQAALQDRAHTARIVANAAQGRAALADGLRRHGVECIDGCGNFLLANFGAAARHVYQGTQARGFILRAMNSYGLPDHLRISIGSAEEIAALVDVIGQLLDAQTQ